MQTTIIISIALILMGISSAIYLATYNSQTKMDLQAFKNGTRNSSTIHNWEKCMNQTCSAGRTTICNATDSGCNLASFYYTSCFQKTSQCQAWEKFHENADAHDRIPQSYFDCNNICEPNRNISSVYWDRWDCNLECAKDNTPPPPPPPVKNTTIHSWSECRDVVCNEAKHPTVCPKNDTQCQLVNIKYSTCTLEDKQCQNWNAYFEKADAYDIMPQSYFNCQENCRPNYNQSSIFFDRWYCDLGCAAE